MTTNTEIAFVVLLVGALAVSATRSWKSAGLVATVFVGLAAVLSWIDGLKVVLGGQPIYARIAALPTFGSELSVHLTPLGAGFLLLITAVSFVATLYSIGYMQSYRQESPARFYGLLLLFVAGMIGVVSVRDWLFFFVFWELMTLPSYFLVTF